MKKDQLKGGLADDKTPKDFDRKKLKEGSKVEMEHTKNKKIAQEIAMDHLTEDSEYYKKLREVEKKEKIRIDEEIDGKQELDYGKEELDKIKVDQGKTVEQKRSDRSKRSYSNLGSDEYSDYVDVSDTITRKPKTGEKVSRGVRAVGTSGQSIRREIPVKDWALKNDQMDAAQSSNQDAQQDLDSIRAKWKKLKKALADEAFMSIGGSEDEEQQEQQTIPDEELHSLIDEHLNQGEEESDDAELSEHEQEGEQQLEEEEVEDEESAEELLSQLGYSDVEIAHIIHGHHFPDVDELKAAKADTERAKKEGELSLQQLEMQIKQGEHSLKSGHAEKLNSLDAEHKKQMLALEVEHTKKMKELEYEKARRAAEAEDETEHKKRLRDVEYEKAKKDIPGDRFDDTEHQKRMMDIEYERAKRELELDLEIKKRQAELKMKQMEEDAKAKAAERKEDVKFKAEDRKVEREQQKIETKQAPKKK